MTSTTPIGNSLEGFTQTSIEGRQCGIDGAGNFVLNTKGNRAGNPSRGVPGILGFGIPYNIGITNGVGATANLANVAYQVQDAYGNPVAGIFVFDLWLSDNASGGGLTAVTASGGVAMLAGGFGTVLGVGTVSKALRVSTNTSGLATLVITDTAKTGFYPVAALLPGMPAVVGAQLTTGSYHA